MNAILLHNLLPYYFTTKTDQCNDTYSSTDPYCSLLNCSYIVKPTVLKVVGPSEAVVAGEMVSLTCMVEGARPPATIDWFNRSDLIEPQPSSTDELMIDSTFR